MRKARPNDEDDCPLCLMLEQTHGMRLAVPYDEIVNAGVSLPPAELLTDQQIAAKLDELFEVLTALRVCIASTDHLSDRELYRRLCDDVLRQETDLFDSETSATTIDLIGGGSAEDIEIYLTYYADEETRDIWARDFPDDVIPERKPTPFDRDRFLPSAETLLSRGGH